MNKVKPKCFISYSHEDADWPSIRMLVEQIRQASRNNIDIFYDEDLTVGSKINKFMNLIASVDAIFIILTPSYKSKILSRSGGAYTEFNFILQKISKLEEASRSNVGPDYKPSGINIFPILFSGTPENSVPSDISHFIWGDFRKFRANISTDAQAFLRPEIEREFFPTIQKMVSSILVSHTMAGEAFNDIQERWFRTLFMRTKHEWQRSSIEFSINVEDKIFVKTYAYRRIDDQAVCLLIGRKGSGKSTVTSFISRPGGRYKHPIVIMANNFDLEMIFNWFINSQIGSDARNVFNQVKLFSVSWELFIHICCMYVLVIEDENGMLSSVQKRYIEPIDEYLNSIIGESVRQRYKETINNEHEESAELFSLFFNYSISEVMNCFENAINTARNDPRHFLVDVAGKLNFRHIKKSVASDLVWINFFSIVSHCKRKFLIAMDGFDTLYEEFRRHTLAYSDDDRLFHQRISLEMDWLRSFLHLVLRIRSNHERSIFFNSLEFSVTVPKDRFLEIRETERDAYLYRGRFIEINWSGIELSIMLRKRLEVVFKYDTPRHLRPRERLLDVLEFGIQNLPKTVTAHVGGKRYVLELFLYVLRHTFWRPRDVLFFMANIIGVARNFEETGQSIDEEAVKRAVANTTKEIIESEFIGEFSSYLRNVRDILRSFSRSSQFLTYEEIYQKIGLLEFDIPSQKEPITSMPDKLAFLYSSGFIGIVASEEMKRRFIIGIDHVFFFNEGDEMFREICANMTEYKYVIHPIFCEYLMLDTSGQDLVLNITWEYLRDNEAKRFFGM